MASAGSAWTDGVRRPIVGVPYGEPVLPAPGRSVEPPAAGSGNSSIDEWLVAKAKDGDADAFDALIRRHHTQIYRIALRILGNPHDAQDVTQDVLIQLWGSLAGFLGSSAFTTWLYRMVVNRSLNHRRRSQATAPSAALLQDDRPVATGPAEEVIARQRADATARAISALPAEQRAVVVLHQLEGFAYTEVAAILGVPESTVRGRLARGRRTLVEQLREWA